MGQSKLTIKQLRAPTTSGLVPISDGIGGADWGPQSGGSTTPRVEVGAAAGIDLTAVAQTTIYTVPTGKKFIPTRCVVAIQSITGAGTMPTVRFGTSGSPASLVVAEQLDASMNAVSKTQGWQVLGDVLAAGTVLQFGVTTGGGSTTHVATAIIEGLLLDA